MMEKIVRGVDAMYPNLNVDTIKKLPVGAVTDDNCILALWVPSAFLTAGLEVMKAWGFDYRQLWIWGKTSKNDPTKLAFGMGRLGRNCHEPCLVGVKESTPSSSRIIRKETYCYTQPWLTRKNLNSFRTLWT